MWMIAGFWIGIVCSLLMIWWPTQESPASESWQGPVLVTQENLKHILSLPPQAWEPPTIEVPLDEELPIIRDAIRSGVILSAQLLAENLNDAAVKRLFLDYPAWCRILSEPFLARPNSRQKFTILDGRHVYMRLSRFDYIEELAEAWGQVEHLPGAGLLLDLRGTSRTSDTAGACDWAGLLIAAGTPLIELHDPRGGILRFRAGRQPLRLSRQNPVVVLIDESTRGAGETLALLLRRHTSARLVGRPTAGLPGHGKLLKLPSGRILYLAQEAVYEPGSPAAQQHPIQPDVLLVGNPIAERQAAMRLAADGPMAVAWELPDWPRRSERSLLRRETPELDAAMQMRSQTTPDAPRDPLLVSAIDLLRALSALAGADP